MSHRKTKENDLENKSKEDAMQDMVGKASEFAYEKISQAMQHDAERLNDKFLQDFVKLQEDFRKELIDAIAADMEKLFARLDKLLENQAAMWHQLTGNGNGERK